MRTKFGEWCDLRGIAPTMGNVDVYVEEQLETLRRECRAKENDLIELERLSGMSLEKRER
jgi:hypothetical protein